MGALFCSYHYAVHVVPKGNYNPPHVELYEREKDALKAAKHWLWNAENVTVYALRDSFAGDEIFRTSKKLKLVAVPKVTS